MIKLFKNNRPYVIFLIPLIVGIHLLFDIYFPDFGNLQSGSDNLWKIDFSLLSLGVSRVLAFAFVSLNAILLNVLFNRMEFYSRLTYIPSILYVLLIFIYPASLRFNDIIIAHFFFLFSFYSLVKINQNEDARKPSFASGFFLGIAASFLPFYSPFFILIWVGIYLIRPFKFREHILPLLGFFTIFPWVFIINPSFLETIDDFQILFSYHKLNIYLYYVLSITLGFLLVNSFKRAWEHRGKSSIHLKRIILISILTVLLTSFLAYLIAEISDGNIAYFATTSIIFPFVLSFSYLDNKENLFANFLFYILLLGNILKFFPLLDWVENFFITQFF